MKKDQAGIATDKTFGNSARQEATLTTVEEYLNLAECTHHLDSGKDGVGENSVALFKDVRVYSIEPELTY
jgi:hypothetical protein